MKKPRWRSKLVIGVAVAALAGGATAAILARRAHESPSTRAGRQAPPGATSKAPGAATTAPEGQARAPQEQQKAPSGKHAAPHLRRGTRPGAPAKARGDLAVAAAYLEISRARLRRELRSGRPLAAIADGSPGRSSSGLIEALVKARAARLAAAVERGRLDPGQERRRLAILPRLVAARINAIPGAAGASSDIQAAAHYTGISQPKLRHKLRAGRTLAQIAQEVPGKSTRGLINAMVAARRSRLAAAVAAGALTSKQEHALLAKLEERVTRQVNRPRRHPARGAPAHNG